MPCILSTTRLAFGSLTLPFNAVTCPSSKLALWWSFRIPRILKSNQRNARPLSQPPVRLLSTASLKHDKATPVSPLVRPIPLASAKWDHLRSIRFTSQLAQAQVPYAVDTGPIVGGTRFTPSQASLAACHAIRLSMRAPSGNVDDALLILDFLLYPNFKSDPSAPQLSQLKNRSLDVFQRMAPHFPFTTSPRLAVHTLLHRLGFMRPSQAAALAINLMQNHNIRIHPKTLKSIFIDMQRTANPIRSPVTQASIMTKRYKPNPKTLEDIAYMASANSTRLAIQMFEAARETGQSGTGGIFGTLLAICLLNTEVVIASLLFGFVLKEWQVRQSLAGLVNVPSTSTESIPDISAPTCTRTPGWRPTVSYAQRLLDRDTPRAYVVVPDPSMLNQLVVGIKRTFERNSRDVYAICASMQALATLADLLDQRLYPFPPIASLIRVMYHCPRIDHQVWILDRHEESENEGKKKSEPKTAVDEQEKGYRKGVAYFHVHDVLKRLIETLPRTQGRRSGYTRDQDAYSLPELPPSRQLTFSMDNALTTHFNRYRGLNPHLRLYPMLPPLDIYSLNTLLHYTFRHLLDPDTANIILKHMIVDRRPPVQPDQTTYNVLMRNATLLRDDSLSQAALEAMTSYMEKRSSRWGLKEGQSWLDKREKKRELTREKKAYMKAIATAPMKPNDDGVDTRDEAMDLESTLKVRTLDAALDLRATARQTYGNGVERYGHADSLESNHLETAVGQDASSHEAVNNTDESKSQPDASSPFDDDSSPTTLAQSRSVSDLIHTLRTLDLSSTTQDQLSHYLFSLTTLLMHWISTGRPHRVSKIVLELFPEMQLGLNGKELKRRQESNIYVDPDTTAYSEWSLAENGYFNPNLTSVLPAAIAREIAHRKQLRRAMVKRASRYGPHLFAVLLNALYKARKFGLAKALWIVAQRAERYSWTKPYPWVLSTHAYTSILRCWAAEYRKPKRGNPKYRVIENAAIMSKFRMQLRELSQAEAEAVVKVVDENVNRRIMGMATAAAIRLYHRLKNIEDEVMAKVEKKNRVDPLEVMPGGFPQFDGRFANALLEVMYPKGGAGLEPEDIKEQFELAKQKLVERGELGPGWTPLLQEIGEDIVQTGLEIPPGLRKIFLGRWEEGTKGKWERQLPPHLRFEAPPVSLSFPDPEPQWCPFGVPIVRTKGLPEELAKKWSLEALKRRRVGVRATSLHNYK